MRKKRKALTSAKLSKTFQKAAKIKMALFAIVAAALCSSAFVPSENRPILGNSTIGNLLPPLTDLFHQLDPRLPRGYYRGPSLVTTTNGTLLAIVRIGYVAYRERCQMADLATASPRHSATSRRGEDP